jgi:cbb3-type cytochrome oxidase subunit 3
MEVDVIEAIGTFAFFLFSLALAYIAINVSRFSRFGQEALLAAAAMMFTAALMRSLVFIGWIEREQAVVVNSIAVISFLIIGLQLAALRYVNAHVQESA